jgi:putative methyltransferase
MKKVYLAQMSLELPGTKYYYFPYSVGVVWSYAATKPEICDNYCLKELMFVKEPVENVVDRMENPSVLGLSSYAWNTNYNEELARQVKVKWPNCIVIVGGANAPDSDLLYFEDKPYIDYLIHQEGEISFAGLLKSFIGIGSDEKVPGISINRDGVRISTGKSLRINDLSEVPSPYLSGLFDDIVEKYVKTDKLVLNGIIETNRGCPFKCTFCDWGGTTFGKVKKFDIARIEAEVNWFADNKIEYINNTDANFGIFKERDMAIVDMLIDTKEKKGFPQIFDTNWNKNNNDTTVRMASKLLDAGMMRRFTASLQSMNPDVLTAIKRTNLNGDQLDNIVLDARRMGIGVNTEMIVGLPEETYDSWKDGICQLLKDDFIVESYPLALLQNSELNYPAYKEKYGIKTKKVRSYFSNFIDEWQDMVVATRTMDESTMSRVWLWTWLTNKLESNGFTQLLSRYLEKRHNIPQQDFYEALLEAFLTNEDSVYYPHLQKWSGYAERLEFQYFIAGYVYGEVLIDIGQYRRAKFLKEVYEVANSLLPEFDPMLSQVMELQDKSQRQVKEKTYTVVYDANLYEYLTSDEELIYGTTTYTIHSQSVPDRFNGDWQAFMNFARKNRGWANKIEAANEVIT